MIKQTKNGMYCIPKAIPKDKIYSALLEIIDADMVREGTVTSRDKVKRYLITKLGMRQREIFSVVYLDSQHQIIRYEEPFKGTINKASVWPREIAKRALTLNAAAVILAHNHPSGDPTPSASDHAITHKITDALALFEIAVLDHIVVGGTNAISFSEKGYLSIT